MENINFYTLKLKLNRHKLRYQILNGEKSIQLGGANITFSSWLVSAILPILASIILIILTVNGIIPAVKLLVKIIIGVPFALGLFGIVNLINKKKMNKNIKIIEKDQVKIIEKGHTSLLEGSMIKELKVVINKNDQNILQKDY